MGVPAKVRREVTEAELERVRRGKRTIMFLRGSLMQKIYPARTFLTLEVNQNAEAQAPQIDWRYGNMVKRKPYSFRNPARN